MTPVFRLHLLGLGATLALAPLLLLPSLAEAVPAMLLCMALAALPLANIALHASRAPRASAASLWAVLLWALVLRLLLLFGTEPSLSDDLFRYVWEGRLVAAGLDPFDRAPDHVALLSLAQDAPEWALINHRELPAIYPPGAQWVFGLLASVSPSPSLFRAGMVAIDLLLVAVTGATLIGRGRDPRWAVLYAWHPLVVVEVASSGHYEPLALLPVLVGILLWDRAPGSLPAFACWGLAIATKYVGGAVGWFAARRLWPQRPLAAATGLLLSGLVALLVGLPFALDGAPPLGSLGTYVEHWGHNASVHALLASVLGYHPARKVVAGLFLLWALALTWRGPEPARGFLLLFAGLLVLSPVVHPWYGLWVIALLPLAPSPGLLLLSVLLPLSYLAWTSQAAGGAWQAPPWVPWLEYGAPALLAAALAWRRRTGQGG